MVINKLTYILIIILFILNTFIIIYNININNASNIITATTIHYSSEIHPYLTCVITNKNSNNIVIKTNKSINCTYALIHKYDTTIFKTAGIFIDLEIGMYIPIIKDTNNIIHTYPKIIISKNP